MQDLLGSTVVLLAACSLAAAVTAMLKLRALLGYLAVGAALGPSLAAWIVPRPALSFLSELGVALLLFGMLAIVSHRLLLKMLGWVARLGDNVNSGVCTLLAGMGHTAVSTLARAARGHSSCRYQWRSGFNAPPLL